MAQLTSRTDVPFELSFLYPLANGFTFKEFKERNNKEFQIFLNKVSKMTVDQVNKTLARKLDKNDEYRNCQVCHYEVSGSFRIHGIFENGLFRVIKLDPNHKVHKE